MQVSLTPDLFKTLVGIGNLQNGGRKHRVHPTSLVCIGGISAIAGYLDFANKEQILMNM